MQRTDTPFMCIHTALTRICVYEATGSKGRLAVKAVPAG